jgi:hypothetical protein
MYQIILLFILLYQTIQPFTKNSSNQEYSVLCQQENTHCLYLHELYKTCGILLFNIWLSVDLLLSIKIDYDQNELLYTQLEYKINILHENINAIVNNSDNNHGEDSKKLLTYIEKIAVHPLIKYNDQLLIPISNCQKLLSNITVIKNNTFLFI